MSIDTEIIHPEAPSQFADPKQKEIFLALTASELAEAERRAVIDEMLGDTPEKTKKTLINEFQFLAGLYEARTIEKIADDGTRSRIFATRDTRGEEHYVDDVYTIEEKPDGRTTYRAVFMRNGQQAGYGLEVSDDAPIVARAILSGQSELKLVSGSSRERECMVDFVSLSLKTGGIVLEREGNDPEAAQEAHREGRQLLEEYLVEPKKNGWTSAMPSAPSPLL
jgi:hypothetical protein